MNTLHRWRFGSVGNVDGRVNEVNRRRARLVLGWVTDRLQAGEPSRYVTSHPDQLSLAIPPWVGAVSTSESWDVNRHTARCTTFCTNMYVNNRTNLVEFQRHRSKVKVTIAREGERFFSTITHQPHHSDCCYFTRTYKLTTARTELY